MIKLSAVGTYIAALISRLIIHTNMVDQLTFPDGADFDMINRISSLTGMKGPEVVAGVIAMLASDDGEHITGEHIRVDGGTLS